jgi:transglutaminase-like putative cysteine protease
VLLWRARLALRDAPLPGRWLLIGTLALAAGLTFWSFRSLIGQEPGITLVVLLMALKTLELRARRDAFVVFFLGFFLVLTQFLYSQSLLVAVAMLVSVWGLLTALVLAHMPVGQPALGQAGRLAARTALLGAPIMVLLFLLFPRIGPLWGVPQEGLSTTGLSNSMRMGSVAEVALDDSVALRIRFLDRVPPREAMYFRGPVLSHFDGQEWRPLGSGPAANLGGEAELRVRGTPLRYEMTLEPLKLTVLPMLEATAVAPVLEDTTLRIRQRDDLRWVAQRPVFERLRFTAQAHLAFAHGPRTATAELRDHVALPPGHNPRLLAWGAALRRNPRLAEADGRTLAQAVMVHIRTQGYTYTLAPGVYGERDPMGALDEFWFDRKQGFCEHFAAAFVVAMRAMDVPARVVTGYQGTDPDPVDGYHVVRQSAAHAWAEYWQAGEGWVRADPTAAVAPDRVARSRNLAPPPGFVAGTLGTVNPQLLARFRNAWETVNNRWNQWVLNYSRGQQFDLLQRLGFDAPRWQDLALLLAGVLSTLALAGAGWAWWDHHRTDPWTRQMLRVRSLLHGLGLLAAAHEAPRTLAGRVRQQFAARGEALAELLEALDTQRYGRAARAQPDPALSRRIRLAVRALSRPAR